jgi:competence CoiA-like predicted nuclease
LLAVAEDVCPKKTRSFEDSLSAHMSARHMQELAANLFEQLNCRQSHLPLTVYASSDIAVNNIYVTLSVLFVDIKRHGYRQSFFYESKLKSCFFEMRLGIFERCGN